MVIEVKNLGVLTHAKFSLGNLTVICGNNNTGKTYATYALYGFLAFWRDVFKINVDDLYVSQLLDQGTTTIDLNNYVQKAEKIIADGCKEYTNILPTIFASAPEKFTNAEFKVTLLSEDINLNRYYNSTIRGASRAELFTINKNKESNLLVITLLVSSETVEIPKQSIISIISDAIKEIILGHLFPKPFIASTERTGAAIFRKELNFARNRLLEQMSKSKKEIDPFELLFKAYQDYALPVKANVDFARDIERVAKNSSFIIKEHPEIVEYFDNIIGGKYTVTRNDELYYEPKGKKVKLTMDESSSSIRSLLDIGFYVRHLAQQNDLLIVDEPELNLHPENQRKIARLFAKLINIGVKVFITTHSDYIIKEMNTLIMLNQNKDYVKKIAKEEGYNVDELLSPNQIKVYIADQDLIKKDGGKKRTSCNTLIEAVITDELGIEVKSFDKTIDIMNRIQEAIVWG